MPRILTNLRIDEVSVVDKGVGKNCKILISKRDDSADGDDVYQTDWYKEQVAIAERQNEEHLRESGLEDEDREKRGEGRYLKYFLRRSKSFAADVRGDESDLQDEKAPPVDDVIADGVAEPSAIGFDVGDYRYTFPNERALAVWLAAQERIHKQEESLTKEQLEAARLAKLRSVSPIEIAKILVAENSARGISEAELVDLISNHDRRDGETAAKCFERHYMAQEAVRKALRIAKDAEAMLSIEPVVVDGSTANPDDAAAAVAALQRLVDEQRARAPEMTLEQVWDAAMRERPDLAARAIPLPRRV